MAIRVYKPTSPARRFMSVLTYEEITSTKPEKSLLEYKKKNAGRNAQGKITVRHQGGGNKVKYRIIDFKRDKVDIPAKVASNRVRPQPQRLHRPAELRGRREALHPGSSGPEGGRYRDLQRDCRHQARQRAAHCRPSPLVR